MRRGIIFDVDGVIVDVSQSYHYAIKYTAEHFLKKEIPLQEAINIKFLKGINNDWLATLEVIREFGGEARLEDIVEVFNQFYTSLRDKERLILQREFFERLKDLGYPLGIVTGRPKEDMLYLLERFQLYPYFDFVVDEDSIPQEELRKPHPYALHLCIEALDLDAGVYVGDSLADWQMLKDYRRLYAKPFEYIHVGERVLPEGVRHVPPERLFEVLQEVLHNL
ncbi:MAG: HAD family hydrolase [Aquificaceae bacterium]